MDRQTCTIRVSLPTKLSYMLLHLHTRHTTLVILLTIVKEEGWDMHRRVSQATTRVSGPRLKKGEYRSSWDGGGRGLRANSHLHHICEACLQLKGGDDWLTPAQLVPRRASSSIKRACLPRTTGATCLLSLETCTYYRSVNAETHLAHLLCIQRAFLQLYFNLQSCCFSLSNFDALSVKYFKEFPL